MSGLELWTVTSRVPLGNRRHIDSSLGALILGAVLVGSFLGSPLLLLPWPLP
jgi:hypothetical protein